MTKIIDLSASLTGDTSLPPTVKQRVEFSTFHHPGPGHWQASWASISVHSAAHKLNQIAGRGLLRHRLLRQSL